MKRQDSRFLRRLKLSAAIVFAIVGGCGLLGGQFFNAAASSHGPSPSHTNAPGETNCTACHSSYAPNSGGGSVKFSGLPANYTPGQTIPVTVTVAQPNAVVFGFQFVALDNLNLQAGGYALPAQTPAQLQILNGQINGATRSYVEHTSNGIYPPQGVYETKSWTFNWVAPATRKGRVTLYAAGNGANGDGSTSGDYIYTTSRNVCSGAVQGTFDNDNKADYAVFRPSNGVWYKLSSQDNSFSAVQFGQSGDKIVPGDFDGDGKTDAAVFRNGIWYILRSSDNAFVAYQFGLTGDVPVVGDYDGDGKTDLAVFRPSNGTWYVLNLANNAFSAAQFGQNGDKPMSGDFDGDGKTDFAVFRPATGIWFVLRSRDGFTAAQFGQNGDIPVSGDFDGDGKTDYAVYRNGTWFLQQSTAGFAAASFGLSGDVPVPSDYDGDCKTDLAVYRNGVWYINNSADKSVSSVPFGLSGDTPVPSVFAAQ